MRAGVDSPFGGYMAKEQTIENYMSKLNITREEAMSLMEDDNDIDHDKPKEFDLTPEQLKVAKAQVKAGHTVYTFTKRERKPNMPKREFITALEEAIASPNFLNGKYRVEVVNEERQLAIFLVGEASRKYELTLVEKRKANSK